MSPKMVLIGFVLVLSARTGLRAENPPEKIDFGRQIRPILSNVCFQCHGPDEAARKGDLRLDIKAGFDSAPSGSPLIVPHKPDDSELLLRIITEDETLKMPPPKSGKMIKPEQVELIRKWIEQGGEYIDHWAFTPPVKTDLPAVSDPAWQQNPIDCFILARIDREGLKHSPEADRVTLLRRLSLDLIGLPPTIAEVDAFLADTSPDAYEKQVDRLLSSQHYGERWARNWLDAARYADSDGFEKDKARDVWFYRDYVINALNRDLPYDQFIIEQLAGDQLPHPTQDQLVATGFLRNSMNNEEGGIDPEQFRMEAMFDRMDAIGKSILGLTIQCAQCHTHKYDPVSQEDYYRLFAFLNNDHEANIAVYTPEDQQRRAELFSAIRKIENGLRETHPDWQSELDHWAASVSVPLPAWTVVVPADEQLYTGGQRYRLLSDKSILAEGYAPTKHSSIFSCETRETSITAFQLEQLNDPNLPRNGPGRSPEGTSALSEFTVEYAPLDHPDQTQTVKFVRALADSRIGEARLKPYYDDKGNGKRVIGPVEYAIDGNNDTAWGIDRGPARRNLPTKAVFFPEKPLENPAGFKLTFKLAQLHGGWNSDDNQNHNLGRFRLTFTSTPDATLDPLPKICRDILAIPGDQRTPEQLATLFSYWRTTRQDWDEQNRQIEDLWNKFPEATSQLALSPRIEPRATAMLDRGDFLKPTKQVEPGTPPFLHPFPQEAERTRLNFAKWLVDPKSPTVARSLVNRIWQEHFGTGIVASAEDFGSQSETPSHRELLDWLAADFMEQGWSLKSLHRLIVTSAAYRQSSQVTPELHPRDPENRLLARGPRFRVDAEIVRDIALAASGLLDFKVGGPSTHPPAPDFLFAPPASYGPKQWKMKSPDEPYRRALYTFRFRSVPYPMLQSFDAPNGDFSCVRRSRSNTPLQALTTLNEPLFVESAQNLAERTLREGGSTDADRLAYAFRLCVARSPRPDEVSILANIVQQQRKKLADQPAQAIRLAGLNLVELLPDENEPNPVERAAWTAVARILLNLDETITRE